MTRGRVRVALAVVVVGTVTACVTLPSEWQRATGAGVLLLSVVAALETVAVLSRRSDRVSRGAPTTDEPPAQLRAISRAVSAAERSPRELARQLRPYLRDVAELRLRRAGLSLDEGRPVQELLGDELHDLLVRDIGIRAANREGGLRAVRLRAALDRLERL